MKRIIIIGCPGSGKSYFSKELSKKLKIEPIHLDNLYWNKNKTHCSIEELDKQITPILKMDSFIIEGNYHEILENRFKCSSDVFILDLSLSECIKGIKERINIKRDDCPWIENKEDAEELIEWSKNYKERTFDIEQHLINKYKNVCVHILKSREEVNLFLNNLDK